MNESSLLLLFTITFKILSKNNTVSAQSHTEAFEIVDLPLYKMIPCHCDISPHTGLKSTHMYEGAVPSGGDDDRRQK